MPGQLVKEQPMATSILAGVLEAQGASNLKVDYGGLMTWGTNRAGQAPP